jgi:hypothetical protein
MPLTDWIARLFEASAQPAADHDERVDDLNLGLGWLYYGLGRLLHPRRALVIGADPFAAQVLARALDDNVEPGEVIVDAETYRGPGPIGLVFIAASRNAGQARSDYEAVEALLEPRGVVLFHGGAGIRETVADLGPDGGVQALDLPFGAGLTLVRKLDAAAAQPLLEGQQGRPAR